MLVSRTRTQAARTNGTTEDVAPGEVLVLVFLVVGDSKLNWKLKQTIVHTLFVWFFIFKHAQT
jgi:hypothetical protein